MSMPLAKADMIDDTTAVISRPAILNTFWRSFSNTTFESFAVSAEEEVNRTGDESVSWNGRWSQASW